MTIVAMSDTHNYEIKDVPKGDVLIHAGDATGIGSVRELAAFNAWFAALPHKYKIYVAGNHDWIFQRDPEMARMILDESITYLRDNMVTVGPFNIYGTPWTPVFNKWAFNLSEEELCWKYDKIPEFTDILVSHGPALGCGDGPDRLGSPELACAVTRANPTLHIFGHIHEGYGAYPSPGRLAVNASICDRNYRQRNAPIVIHL